MAGWAVPVDRRRTSDRADTTPRQAAAAGWWTVVSVALGTAIVWAVLRAWLPSVLFVYGRAGSTPATQLGLFALLPFALTFPAVLAVWWRGAHTVLPVAVVVLAGARLGLQATSGGDPQLWTATVGTVAALWWLVALAGSGLDRRGVAFGVSAGLVLDTAWHAALRSIDLVWRSGPLTWAALTVVLAVFVALWLQWRREDAASPGGAAWTWLSVGPAFVLHGILTGQTARLQTVAGLSEPAAAAALTAAAAAGVVAAAYGLGARSRRGGWVAAAAMPPGLAGALSQSRAGVLAGTLVLAASLTFGLARALRARGDASPARRALAAVAGFLLFFLLAFLYYATYDMNLLPFPAEVLLAVGTGVVAVATAFAAVASHSARAWRPALAAAGAAAVLLAALPAAVAERPTTGSGSWPVRVMTYNVHMGFDTRGRLSPEALAEVIIAQRPDVVALEEIDRGWLTTGSPDVLPHLSELTGMPYVFAPAADAVWGNAILSRFPLSDVTVVPLPRGGAPMRRSLVSAVVDLGAAGDLGVVATHFHHVTEDAAVREEQAAAVADVVDELAVAGLPVVVLGDLNAEAADPELAPLRAVLDNALASSGDVATYPSWDPVRHIDHVFVTPQLVASDVVVPVSEASDHLGVAVTLSPR